MKKMSDEEERPITINSPRPTNERRLVEIKSRLHTLTREKTKYNVDKLNQDAQFLRSEIDDLSRAIREMNETIRTQIRQRRTLDAERANYKSHSRVHYSNLETALKEEERLKIELEKPNKNDAYRNLVTEKLSLIAKEKPTLKTLEDYRARLRALDEAQQTAQKKREIFEQNIQKKLERQNEIRDLLRDSEARLPEIEKEIESLRNEREMISISVNTNRKQRRCRFEHLQDKPLDSPDSSSKSFAERSLEWERSFHEDRLEKVRQLQKYFQNQLAERHLSLESPATDLISPLYQSLIINEETPSSPTTTASATATTSATPSTTTTTISSAMPIAIRLPRNFLPLQLTPLAATNNEIIHSPHYHDAPIEYKKELPSDIVDRYAGVAKKSKAATPSQLTPNNFFGKKNKKNKKNSAMKHTAHIISLYNEIRGNDIDLLPSMPMFENELVATIKSLEIIEQSVQSFLNEFSHRCLPTTNAEDFHENESIRDSALDTFSETSSLIEPIQCEKDSNSNRIEQRSTSSSDEKKTIVSSSSVTSSNHSESKNLERLTTVDETASINQIDRQISDEGYRSVRNDQHHQQQQQQKPLINERISIPNFDSAEKVDLWLSNSPINVNADQTFSLISPHSINEFQGTEFDPDEEKDDEN